MTVRISPLPRSSSCGAAAGTTVGATGSPGGNPPVCSTPAVVPAAVVAGSPGLYVIGLPFLRRRKSTLIDGAGADAADLVTHLVGHLA